MDFWAEQWGTYGAVWGIAGGLYLADSFNEMEIPFPPHGDPARYEQLASYGERLYRSISSGNKDAVWVMQGWMFGYQRKIWDGKTLVVLPLTSQPGSAIG